MVIPMLVSGFEDPLFEVVLMFPLFSHDILLVFSLSTSSEGTPVAYRISVSD
jgi:hypothetical protein